MDLQLLPSAKIDKKKWDECLHSSPGPLIYASSVYLDHMADNWDGIIGGDYAFIMPVPWRKRIGIRYCYKVPFIQQSGVFGETVTGEDVTACIALLFQSFKYGDYAFNHINKPGGGQNRSNYVLSLAPGYHGISYSYRDKLNADLSKAKKNLLVYEQGNPSEAIRLFRELYGKKIRGITAADYGNFYKLCQIKQKENGLIVRRVSSGNNVLAIGLLMKDRFRIYNLLSCTTQKGRNLLAGHFLYDSLVKEYAQTGLVFDFEGSDIPGIKHFYKSFGAINQPYAAIHFNRLPFLLRLFKR